MKGGREGWEMGGEGCWEGRERCGEEESERGWEGVRGKESREKRCGGEEVSERGWEGVRGKERRGRRVGE